MNNVCIIHRWDIRDFVFYSMHKGKLLFVYQVFSREGKIIQWFYIDIGLYPHIQ